MPMQSSDTRKARRFEALVAPLRPDLFRYAFWLNRDRALAEDVVQECLVRAWRSFDSLKDEKAAKQWLLTIVRRENARHFERKRLETKDVDDLSMSEQRKIATVESSDVDDMRQAIFKLEETYREPLVLQVLMGYSTQEIATMMDIEQGAVLTRLYRARKKLRSEFKGMIDAVDTNLSNQQGSR